MAKKGLITSLILGAVLTLSLGIYTLVTAIVAITTPVHAAPVAYAYTSEQTITAFSDYSVNDGNLEIQYAEGQEGCLLFAADNTCTFDTDKEYFKNAKVGDVFAIRAVATTDKYGSTVTFDVKVYKQGNGTSQTDPYCIANAEGLQTLANKMETYSATDATNVVGGLLTDDVAGNGFVSLVNNVDLADTEWKGLSVNYARPFNDVFNGNGYAVENMSIHVTAQNYQQYLGTLTDAVGTYTGLSVGFFRNTDGATINGLSLTGANIVVDSDVLAIINPAENSTLEFVRVGLLVGDARYTTFNGLYERHHVTTELVLDTTEGSETFGQEIAVEKVNTTQHNAVVSGSINGFAFGKAYGTNNYAINGIGGIAGAIQDYYSEVSDGSQVVNYNVNLAVTNANDSANIYIGAVAGEIFGNKNTNNVVLNNVDAKLVSNATFNNRNFIGAVAGRVDRVDATNLTTSATITDLDQKYSQFVDWYNNDGDFNKFTDAAGIVAYASKSNFENITANSIIDVYAYTSAGFVYVDECSIANVITSGRVTGYSAIGLAQFLYDTDVTYTAEAEQELIATNVSLAGWYTAGIADYAKDSNITATGSVIANVTITAKGKVAAGSTAIQNTLHSAGLVGYFYTTDTNKANEYLLTGFTVNVTMNNVTDGAGLVAYLGTDADGATCSITNCTVVANITSHTTANTSMTHKVGGAVATIYGKAKLDSNNVTICFNPDQTIGNKYGAAMFGGLVARIANGNVTLTNNGVSGNAYINYTAYTKSFGDSEEYEQILAGGLVGAIASFGKTVAAGTHPVYGTNTEEILETVTYDDVTCIDTTNIKIESEQEVAVNIVIDFAKQVEGVASTCMGEEGYRARAVGSLIGLVMNGKDNNTDKVFETTTALDLSKNKVTGTVSADQYTFSFHTISSPVVGLSSMGYGNVNSAAETPACVGASFDLVSNKQYKTIVFPAA